MTASTRTFWRYFVGTAGVLVVLLGAILHRTILDVVQQAGAVCQTLHQPSRYPGNVGHNQARTTFTTASRRLSSMRSR